MSRLKELSARGCAVWLDFVDKKFLDAGGLRKLVDEDGLTGVTSNPSIFEKAMGHGDAYDAELADYDRRRPDAAAIDRYEHLAVGDIRAGSMKRVAAASGEGSSVVPLVHAYLGAAE